jgi:hypothetical protein
VPATSASGSRSQWPNQSSQPHLPEGRQPLKVISAEQRGKAQEYMQRKREREAREAREAKEAALAREAATQRRLLEVKMMAQLRLKQASAAKPAEPPKPPPALAVDRPPCP